MKPIFKNLYQFSNYIAPMDFTIHQYLLASEPSILFGTGTVQQSTSILPEIKKILDGKPLDYIFVSHIESDECAGVSVFLKEYPEIKVISSLLGARELPGYSYTGEIVVGSPEQEIIEGALDLQFINYPSEVHLQDGLVVLEKNTGIFYSSDLMLRFGNGCEQIVSANWKEEVEKISEQQIPNLQKLNELKDSLYTIAPDFIAVGHGFCLECETNE